MTTKVVGEERTVRTTTVYSSHTGRGRIRFKDSYISHIGLEPGVLRWERPGTRSLDYRTESQRQLNIKLK